MRYVGLLDCNNFFVSCERLFRPDLIGKPVVVLSSNDGCVVARSPEVKALGVPMGVPYFKVRDDLEQAGAVVFSSNFTLYRDISARVMTVLRESVANVEQYSVDEAFFTLPDKNPDQIRATLVHLKHTMESVVGVPVSVGAARTKTIAKCATDIAKRGDGTMLLSNATWREAAETFPLRDVWGVGGRTALRMRECNLHTVSDFLAEDSSRIDQIFGVQGTRLRFELNEQPSFDLRTRGDLQQSIMHTRSFAKTTTSRQALMDAVAYHLEHAAVELRELHACAHILRVMLLPSRHGEWTLHGGVREAVMVLPTDDTRSLLREAHLLVDALYETEVPYKKAGVVLAGLVPKAETVGSLFEKTSDDANVCSVVDDVNRRFGSGTITIGRIHNGAQNAVWIPSREYVSPRYTTSWSEIPTVMA